MHLSFQHIMCNKLGTPATCINMHQMNYINHGGGEIATSIR